MRAVLTSVAFLSPLLIGAQTPPSVNYTLAPEMHGGALTALRVDVSFVGEVSGQTEFRWLSGWAGEDRLYRWVRDLHIDGARTIVLKKPGVWLISAAPSAPLTVHYRVVSAYDSDPTVDAGQSQAPPIIRPTWFFAVGEALFGAPEGRSDEPATFRWLGAPRGWQFASDLQRLANPEDSLGRVPPRPGTVSDIWESIALGGQDVKVSGSAPASDGVRVALRGHYDFSQATFDSTAHKVIASERAFWGEANHRTPFLVAMAPLLSQPARMSWSGTGRTDAFALWVGTDTPLGSLTLLLAHEYFHTWNPQELGGLADGNAEPLGYWFSEGMTNFYGRRLSVRAGLITPQAFANVWNEDLLDYAQSPARIAQNSAITTMFWAAQPYKDLPYQRGEMLAAIWDARLRSRIDGNASLDDVLQFQRKLAATQPTVKASDLFPQAAAHFGMDVRSNIDRYIEHGTPIELPSNVFGPCVTIKNMVQPTYDRGYDGAATIKNERKLVGVRQDSPAYTAGLRDGDQILGLLSGEPGDSSKLCTLRIKDTTGRVKDVSYLPAGRQTVNFQKLVLTPQATANPSVCDRSLSGVRDANPPPASTSQPKP